MKITYIVAAIFLLAWLLCLRSSYMFGGFVHVLPLVAMIAVLYDLTTTPRKRP